MQIQETDNTDESLRRGLAGLRRGPKRVVSTFCRDRGGRMEVFDLPDLDVLLGGTALHNSMNTRLRLIPDQDHMDHYAVKHFPRIYHCYYCHYVHYFKMITTLKFEIIKY
jgi:hypothetical protein